MSLRRAAFRSQSPRALLRQGFRLRRGYGGQVGGQAADDDDVLEPRQLRAIDRVELAQERSADHESTGAAVIEGMRVILRAPERIERHRNDARLDRAEEAVGERGSVLQDQGDALLGLDAETSQGRAEAIDALGDLPVGDLLVAAFDRDLCAASLGDVAIDEMRGRVEDVRQDGHAGILAGNNAAITRAATSCTGIRADTDLSRRAAPRRCPGT